MARILIGWEYGAGFGHVALLVPLAKALQEAGHEPLLMLRDVHNTRPVWEGKDIPVGQAPFIRLPESWDTTIQTDTLADVFKMSGLIDAQKLTALAGAWQSILQKYKPDIVITEFSPTLAMVTLGVIPTITVGIAYAMPPTGRPFPAIRFWNRTVSEKSAAHEQQMFEAVSITRERLKLPPIAYVSDLFGGEEAFTCTYPELDCYAEYRKMPAIGPLVASPVTVPSQHKVTPQKAFLYMSYDKEYLIPIIKEIKQTGIMCDGFVRQMEETVRIELSSPELLLHDAPQKLAEILPERSLLVHHGGISTAEMGLRMGIPQLVVSRHLEQKVNGGLLMRQGVGEIVMSKDVLKPGVLANEFKKVLTEEKYRQHACQKAIEITQRLHNDAMEKVLVACDRWQ